ncbi:hypothetical protein TNCV_1992761 [Trichonephila clavipes]|nr:hypothetical protein TNCV_1992761 [Trichonephila clavipes]
MLVHCYRLWPKEVAPIDNDYRIHRLGVAGHFLAPPAGEVPKGRRKTFIHEGTTPEGKPFSKYLRWMVGGLASAHKKLMKTFSPLKWYEKNVK